MEISRAIVENLRQEVLDYMDEVPDGERSTRNEIAKHDGFNDGYIKGFASILPDELTLITNDFSKEPLKDETKFDTEQFHRLDDQLHQEYLLIYNQGFEEGFAQGEQDAETFKETHKY